MDNLGWTCFLWGVIIVVLAFVLNHHQKKKQQEKQMDLEIQNKKKIDELSKNSFNITKRVEIDDNMLFIDDRQKLLSVSSNNSKVCIFKYADLIEYELFEDGNTISKGKMGNAIVGSALFGVAGAVIGASGRRETTNLCTTLQLRLTIKDMQNPVIVLDFIKSAISKSSITYKSRLNTAKEMVAVLQNIQNQVKENKEAETLNVIHQGNKPTLVEGAPDDSKICPMCAETIKSKAIVCRFCGYKFNDTGLSQSN